MSKKWSASAFDLHHEIFINEPKPVVHLFFEAEMVSRLKRKMYFYWDTTPFLWTRLSVLEICRVADVIIYTKDETK
jgi:hypothetical protein